MSEFLKARGIGRVGDNEKAVILYFDRTLTDDEIRHIHDNLRVPVIINGRRLNG